MEIFQLFTTLNIKCKNLHYQSHPQELVSKTIDLHEGVLSDSGALCVNTGQFTGRSPKDRFIVRDDMTRDKVYWGDINIPFSEEAFDSLCGKVCAHLSLKEVFMRDSFVGADTKYHIAVLSITESPWADLFCHHLFIRPEPEVIPFEKTDWLILHAPGFLANPLTDGTRQSNFSILNFTRKILLIGGTAYTGEIKKGMFSVMNFILPSYHKILSMHCSANEGKEKDVALFFGLSGTGKTTLSADINRTLIGDDEHGWAEGSVFNFEGGCYAKCIHLSKEKEPQIFSAIKNGTLLENTVFFDNTKTVNYEDATITENTRAAYPIDYILNAKAPSVGKNPKNIFFLACDAFGVLPPISRLTNGQAMYHYVSGYTAKIAGTEIGINEPQPVFSACFGKVFLPLNPVEYAELLGRLLECHPEISVWLVNTGWIGGGYGVGERISLKYTRAMINAALKGSLNNVAYKTHSHFGVTIPQSIQGVPSDILNPGDTWKDKSGYEQAADDLARLFINNFKQYEALAGPETRAGAPKVSSCSSSLANT